ncbi:Cytochrome P450 [Penicillium occitanis (nom. inval.)]|nr:Cytochrome P450 [Penicillium occitanis (nom. inval.)]PCH03386.1 hypothetical protein PENOC_038870 [Penicillium occitanis (nom. inval.)]
MSLSVVLAGVAILAATLHYFFGLKLDPREPPLLPQKVPLIGHLIGFLRNGNAYYLDLSMKHGQQICTLAMPYGRTYVVNSTKLVSAVQRNAKTISFDPILTTVAERLAGITGPELEALKEEETGGGGAHRKVVHSMAPSLIGLGLDAMNKAMLANLENFINALETQDQAFDLWAWTRHVISIASTDAVFGPENPYAKDNYEQTFWEYELNITLLLVNVFPQYTAKGAYQQREFMAEKMIDYYRRGCWKQGSEMIKARYQTGIQNGASLEAIARLDVPGGTGILSNTVPTAFWTLCNVFSSPELLADVRREAEKLFTIDQTGPRPVYTLDTSDLRTGCPILFSAYQETMRTRACFASPRYVLEDTLLNGEYLLKKGALLQIPAAVLHHEQSQWGSDAASYDPYRFTKQSSTKRSPVAYRAFGGAPALCPGRHFATVEVLCFVTMLVMRYDMTPAGGNWELPPPNYSNVAASILPPLGDIKANVTVRKGYENIEWKFKVTETPAEKSAFGLASD